MRFGPDPRITIPASGLRKRRNQGLTEDCTRSPVQKVKNPLASRAATTEVLTLATCISPDKTELRATPIADRKGNGVTSLALLSTAFGRAFGIA